MPLPTPENSSTPQTSPSKGGVPTQLHTERSAPLDPTLTTDANTARTDSKSNSSAAVIQSHDTSENRLPQGPKEGEEVDEPTVKLINNNKFSVMVTRTDKQSFKLQPGEATLLKESLLGDLPKGVRKLGQGVN